MCFQRSPELKTKLTAKEFRLPNNTQRTSVIGRTGTGKSVFGMWLLSESDFSSQPWVIVDYKRDELINSIDRIKEIGLNEVPKHPGLYRVHPHPDDEDGVDAFLMKVWERENTGLFFDEAYMLPDKGGLRAVYTQGRSKHIPAITVSQRPVWLSRFAFTQADFHAVFHLNDNKDEEKAGSFMPRGSLKKRLPDHHSKWYDVGQDALFTMQPAPPPEQIQETIMDRLKPKTKVF